MDLVPLFFAALSIYSTLNNVNGAAINREMSSRDLDETMVLIKEGK